MSHIKEIPFGVSNFLDIAKDSLYYVDKTMYLPSLEAAGRFLFMIRPRRFGKSIFLTMMKDYYDINMADRFSEEFAGTWIADHPTPLQGKFQVLYLDFSLVSSSGGDTIKEQFYNYFDNCIDMFFREYKAYYDKDFIAKTLSVGGQGPKLENLAREARAKGYMLYLIVDEYDNFTNTILSRGNKESYTSITQRDGFYREAFKAFKPNFHRIIMMGVSPITLFDLTSGYNIATNLSFEAGFNQMLGFSEDDVREMIRYYREAGQISMDEDEIMDQMRPWYDNYCFSRQSFGKEPGMYNSNMVLYYLSKLTRTKLPPESMVDPNSRSDYDKLRSLVEIDRKHPESNRVILEAATRGFIEAPLAEQLSVEDMAKEHFLPSMLTYQGALTIGGTIGKNTRLVVPNLNAREQFYDFMVDIFRDVIPPDDETKRGLERDAATKGNWTELISFVMDAYAEDSTKRLEKDGERLIHGYLLGVFRYSSSFDVSIEVDANTGYCDMLFLPALLDGEMHSCVLEIKYLRDRDSEASANEIWERGVSQVNEYASSPKIQKATAGTVVHKLVLMARVTKVERLEEISS